MRFKHICTALSLIGLASCASVTQEPKPFSFVVIGDTPYSAVDKPMLETAKAKIKQADYPFIIHVGDYKGGGAACTAEHDLYQQNLIKALAPLPVFYTPGDNEWTDCDRFEDPKSGKAQSELERLEIVRSLFLAHAPKNSKPLNYKRQTEFRDNAAWRYGGVQFATLHITGTNNSRDWVGGDTLANAKRAVTERDAANLVWLTTIFHKAEKTQAAAIIIAIHADITDVRKKPDDVMCTDVSATHKNPCDAFTDFRYALQNHAKNIAIPVLLIHGDTAPFTLNQKMAGEGAPNLWRLNAAGDAGIGRTGQPYGTHDVTLVSYSPNAENPFSAIGLTTSKRPKQ